MIPPAPALAALTWSASAAAEDSGQAQVTDWPSRLALTGIMVAVIALTLWAMRRGWQRRTARQDWFVPAAAPEPFTATEAFAGRYLATVHTADWLDRITAGGLGMAGHADIALGPAGVRITRTGESELFIPAGALVETTSARGIAQHVFEADGIVALTWRSGEHLLTTGLRMQDPADHAAILHAATTMTGEVAP